jgi:hypothetical protein
MVRFLHEHDVRLRKVGPDLFDYLAEGHQGVFREWSGAGPT